MRPLPRDFERALAVAQRTGREPNDAALASLVGLARQLPAALASATPPMRPEFRAALRQELLTAAAPPAAAPVSAAPPVGEVRPVRPVRAAHVGRRVAAAVVALLVASGVATAAASSNAVPGDGLYPVKRGLEQLHLGLMQGDASRGQEQLAQAQTRLVELRTLTRAGGAATGAEAGRTETGVRQAFSDLRGSATDGTAALVRSYQQVGSTIPLRELDDDLSRLSTGLRELAPALPASLTEPARLLAGHLGQVQARVHDMLATCATPCDTIPRTGKASTLPVIELPFTERAGGGTATAPASPAAPAGSGSATGGTSGRERASSAARAASTATARGSSTARNTSRAGTTRQG